MNGDPADLEDPRLFQVVQEYQAALEVGHRPDRATLLQRYPDLADALGECLDGLDLVHAGAAGLDAEPTGLPAQRLGDYRILREIGRGGMGVVYEAEQLSLGRRVALKVLPFAAALDARHLQRFKSEAQAAAHLRHPNIVPVFGVGCDQGVHYYAMQLIEGRTLADLIDERRDPHGEQTTAALSGPGPAFFRQAAEIGVQVASALDHAHQEGVIHRDIKPANLLVDGAGKPWVADFGLAHFQADAGLTLTGDLLGTLRYMSPEQTLGKRAVVDHRTDIYSLGATLYELLAGTPAIAGGDRQEVLRRIAAEDPCPPRTFDPNIPLDLDTVVLKALAKNPAERYATAAEMADDLRRFLEDRPVLARRPTAIQRLSRWGRRHQPLVAAGLALLMLSAAGSAVSAVLIAREHSVTKAALASEREKAAEAEKSFRQARQVVDVFTQVGEEDWADGPSQMVEFRRRLLDTSIEYYQQFIEQRKDNPALREELTATRARVTRLLEELLALESSKRLLFVTNLMDMPEVRAELRLTEEQTQKVTELIESRFGNERVMDTIRELSRLPADQRRKQFKSMAESVGEELAAILTPAQFRRARQIDLQMRGGDALSDPEVVQALNLSAEQRKQIRALIPARSGPPWRNHEHSGGPPDEAGPSHGPPEDDVRPALDVLTAEQQAQWKELTGEPFHGRRKFPHGGIGGPPGRLHAPGF